MSSSTPPVDAVPIEVNGQVIDPQETYAKNANNTDFIIVTVRQVLNIAEEEELQKLSVEILEDLGDNNFLCRYTPKDLGPIRKKEYVRQVDVYRNKYKIPAALETSTQQVLAVSSNTAGKIPSPHEHDFCLVDILTHETIQDEEFEDLKKFIAEKSGVPLDRMEFAPGQVRLRVDIDKLVEIAQNDKVRIIEEVLEAQLMSSDSYDPRSIIRGGVEVGSPSYRGKGQIITVTDTGFDIGSRDDCHPAFAGKVLSLRPIARSKDAKLSEGQKTNDPHGHGTHVSGIILGQDFNTTKGLVGGIAPDAKLIVQSLYRDSLHPCALPTNLLDFLEPPYEQGSRIFSNSWGVGSTRDKQPDYAEPAKVIDNFVRSNPEALVLFSAGNDNLNAVGQPTVGLHAGAKNVLTVGATGNQDAPGQMYEKSSMGPTKEQRLKPDVVAPGVSIFAALSRGVAKYYGDSATAADTPDVKWRSWSGTSQATPLVAGCAAVLREALQERGLANPPGALLKAVIINGADRLPDLPTNAQGHGRVNLQASLALLAKAPARSGDIHSSSTPSMISGTLIGEALRQDEEHNFELAPISDNDPNTHFKITMVYNDIGNKQIQNNLNLFVTDAGTDTVVSGNNKSLTDPDVQNNVEQIILSYGPRGGLKVRVHAQKILAQNDQDYVLAWSTFTPLAGTVFNS